MLASPIGYLAWGYDGGAAFWYSSDGIDWQRAATIPSFSFDFVGTVVWFQGRFVALSEGNTPAGAEPHIWVSDDGLTWSDQTDTIGCDGGQQRYDASGVPGSNVIVLGDQIVTVGTAYVPASEGQYRGPEDYRRVVVTSSDAVCWTKSSAPSLGWTNAVVATADGLVVVGRLHDQPDAGAGSPFPPIAASVSSGGWTWTASTFADGAPNGSLDLLAHGDRGLLALGSLEDGTGLMAWRSVDGTGWTQLATPIGDAGYLTSVTAIPGGFIAVGRETAANGDVTSVAWIAH